MKKDCDIIVIGGSAGSLEVILKMLPKLKHPLKFAIVIVLHRKKTSDTTLLNLLTSKTHLPVREVEDKDTITAGTIFIAPPDYHLLAENNYTFSLDYSEKINFSRPSIDPTFETIADVFRKKAFAILLSGANADGVTGLKAIKNKGGVVIAQSPETAEVPYMPEQAILNVDVNYVLTVDQIIEFINAL
jgi:two-component system chemotaxis response regulator CheB